MSDSNNKKPKIETEEKEYDDAKEDDDENDCSDDGDDDSIGVPLIVNGSSDNNAVIKVEKPANGLEWDDGAIENCLNVAIETHDSDFSSSLTRTTLQTEWQIPSLNQNNDDSNWSPQSLPLPIWAVNPFC